MALSIASRLPRPRPGLALNVVIVVLVVVDVMVGLSVITQRAAADAAQPLIAAVPATAAPAAPSAATPRGAGETGKVSRAAFEELQSSLVVAQAPEVQNQQPITALDLSTAIPGLTFINGFTAVGDGIIGVSSTDAGLLLLTEVESGSWVCAASDVAGTSVLGVSPERAAVSSVAGCGANPR